MKSLVRLALLITLLAAMPAAAAEVRLQWDGCGANGTSLRTFACDTNSGSETILISFTLDAPMPQVNGMLSTLQLAFPSTVPSWWSTPCRATSSFQASVTPGPGCTSTWPATAAGGVSYEPTFYSPGLGRLRGVFAVPGGDEMALAAGVEYFAHRFTVNHSRTIGTGSCGGCTQPALIFAQSVLIYQASGLGDFIIFGARADHRSYVAWQCDGTLQFDHGTIYGATFTDCAVSARRPTWGAIKQMYR